MPRTGWSHLVVTRASERAMAADPSLHAFATTDGGYFSSEEQLLEDLGAAGWELLFVRAQGDDLLYYFKRPRA